MTMNILIIQKRYKYLFIIIINFLKFDKFFQLEICVMENHVASSLKCQLSSHESLLVDVVHTQLLAQLSTLANMCMLVELCTF